MEQFNLLYLHNEENTSSESSSEASEAEDENATNTESDGYVTAEELIFSRQCEVIATAL